jgi:hypothetical protein
LKRRRFFREHWFQFYNPNFFFHFKLKSEGKNSVKIMKKL